MDDDLVCGPHAVLAALTNRPQTVSGVWISEGRRDRRIDAVIQAARAAGVKFQRVPRPRLDRMAGALPHQGVVARRQPQTVRGERDLPEFLEKIADVPLLLVLDGVQDPQNLGACLRSANAAGAQAVIVPRDRSAAPTAAASRAAAGAVETTPIFRVTNLARSLEILKDAGIWLIGATPTAAQEMYRAEFTGPTALVLGGESGGLRRLIAGACDVLVRIPMRGRVQSLNVSVAAGVCLFEAVRQRHAQTSL